MTATAADAAAMHRRRGRSTRCQPPIAAQEVGVVVDADDRAAPVRGEPRLAGDAGQALDHRAVHTAVHDAHRLQQLGQDLQLCPRPSGLISVNTQAQFACRTAPLAKIRLHALVSTRPAGTGVCSGVRNALRDAPATDTVKCRARKPLQYRHGEWTTWRRRQPSRCGYRRVRGHRSPSRPSRSWFQTMECLPLWPDGTAAASSA